MADDGEEMMIDDGTNDDFFDHEPSKAEKIEMRKANKTPSEWLHLLCKDWASQNEAVVEGTDDKFLEYKSYLKGLLSPQLLCRLSIPPSKEDETVAPTHTVDFWGILGVEDEFDKAYIIAQVERFSALYNIRGQVEEVEGLFDNMDPSALAAAAAAGIAVSPGGGIGALPPYMPGMDAAAAVAAAAAAADVESGNLNRKHAAEVSKAHKMAKDAEKALEAERRNSMKREQRRMSQERKEGKAREREDMVLRKAAERAARDTTREERRRKKLEIRMQREQFHQEQKNLALKRAAELVQSNRVPIEITRGAAAAKAAANAAISVVVSVPDEDGPSPKRRSAIIVSNAGDLHQIVTHSKNLFAKYNAIAKEHNQKVNWSTVARELGIHVKVREKYARMHARAEQRGFDWEKNAHYRIKDHPEIFVEPTAAEQKARMPPPPPDPTTTVLIGENKEIVDDSTEDAVAAAAAVVDASVVPTSEEQAAAVAAVAATMVVDPTAGLEDHTSVHV